MHPSAWRSFANEARTWLATSPSRVNLGCISQSEAMQGRHWAVSSLRDGIQLQTAAASNMTMSRKPRPRGQVTPHVMGQPHDTQTSQPAEPCVSADWQMGHVQSVWRGLAPGTCGRGATVHSKQLSVAAPAQAAAQQIGGGRTKASKELHSTGWSWCTLDRQIWCAPAAQAALTCKHNQSERGRTFSRL